MDECVNFPQSVNSHFNPEPNNSHGSTYDRLLASTSNAWRSESYTTPMTQTETTTHENILEHYQIPTETNQQCSQHEDSSGQCKPFPPAACRIKKPKKAHTIFQNPALVVLPVRLHSRAGISARPPAVSDQECVDWCCHRRVDCFNLFAPSLSFFFRGICY